MEGQHFLHLLQRRRSVRSFEPKPVEREKVRLMLEAARLAPSSCNTQPWRIVVVDRSELIAELSRCAPVGTRVNKWMATAPVVFVLGAQPHALIHKAAAWVDSDCHRLDLGIAGEHICLMATALGLGSCWVGWFSEDKVRRLLGLPDALRLVALIPVGYPAEGALPADPNDAGARRKPLEEFVFYNRYGDHHEPV